MARTITLKSLRKEVCYLLRNHKPYNACGCKKRWKPSGEPFLSIGKSATTFQVPVYCACCGHEAVLCVAL
ncbi:hypothetical protein LCGC14_1796240 [marine sediment metagenome]|uniref:Uncharacterized protein n=1 Tax=marine sediment metagenome TaxID=412755 RepID=A0A0F9HDQ6_9ZZZZ